VITYTHAVAPDAPAAPTTTVSGSNVFVAWTAPAANGAAITSYVLKFKQNNGIFSASASTAISGLNAVISISALTAAPYSLPVGGVIKATVVAVNSVGSSAASVEGGAAVMPNTNTVPNAPTNLALNVAFRTRTQTGLTWTTPSDNGGSAITGYNVLENNVLVASNIQTTSHIAVNLVLG